MKMLIVVFLALASSLLAAPPTMLDAPPGGYRTRMLLLDAGMVSDTRPTSSSEASTWTIGIVSPAQSLGRMVTSTGAYRYTTDAYAYDGVDWPRLVEVSGWEAEDSMRADEAMMRAHLLEAVQFKALEDQIQTYPGLSVGQKDDLSPIITARKDAAKAAYDAIWAALHP